MVSPALQLSAATEEELRKIPGVFVRAAPLGHRVRATLDVLPYAEAIVGVGCVEPLVRPRAPGISATPLPERLHSWQREGALALRTDEKRCLFWSTGIGKTAAALSAAQTPCLVITRAMGRDVWPRDLAWVRPRDTLAIVIGTAATEAQRSAAQRYSVRRANKRLEDLRAKGANVTAVGGVSEAFESGAQFVVVGWEVLVHHADALRAHGWETMIADESHCAAGRLAARTKAAKEIARSAKRAWLLTATPIPDRVRGLATQLALIDPDAWDSDWKFAFRYAAATPTPYGGLDTRGSSHLDELRGRLLYWADFRTRQEVAHELPPKTREIIRVSAKGKREIKLPPPASGHWKRAVEAAIAYAAEVKLPEICERVSELLIGCEKIVLIGNRRAWVPRAAALIEKRARRVRRVSERLWLRATSGVDSVSDRQALAREFQDLDDGPAILIATIDSIGESIDLQDADRMILAAVPYTPRKVIQVEGRVGRLGGRPCTIEYIIADQTIDEVIEDMLLRKLDTIVELGAASVDVNLRGSAEDEQESIERLSAWLRERAADIDGAALDLEED